MRGGFGNGKGDEGAKGRRREERDEEDTEDVDTVGGLPVRSGDSNGIGLANTLGQPGPVPGSVPRDWIWSTF